MSQSPCVWVMGAGRMGGALIDGWMKSGVVPAKNLMIFDPHPRAEALAAKAAGAQLNPDFKDACVPDCLLLAVKPQIWRDTAPAIAAHLPPACMALSIAAGVRFTALSEVFGARPLARAMPNTPAAIGQGVIGLVMGPGSDKATTSLARKLLTPLGLIEPLRDESLMDALTAVSGSGPAYVFLLVEAMAGAGVSAGLSPEVAMRLARQTVIGAGAMLAHEDTPAANLREAVTSPGGTTQAALDVLMEGGGMGAMMRRAVDANMRRAKELGRD